jgi:predicted nucleic acid-binding Zn ribbon protein
MSADFCVMCGEIIPEGRMVCLKCETDIMEGKREDKNAHTDSESKR